MRLVMMIAAFGLWAVTPFIVSTAALGDAPAARPILTAGEQALQIRMVTFAEEGDEEAIRVVLNEYIAAGEADTIVRVAKAVANLALQVAGTSCDQSARLIGAAITLVSDPAVSGSDPATAAYVGILAAQLVKATQSDNPAAAATVQSMVAAKGNAPVKQAYALYAPKLQDKVAEQEPWEDFEDEPLAAPA